MEFCGARFMVFLTNKFIRMKITALTGLTLISLLLCSYKVAEDKSYSFESEDPPFLEHSTQWADSILNKLSDRQKIAQLFMVAAYSNRDEQHIQDLIKLVEKQEIGGVIFFQGGPERHVKMLNRLQEVSTIPLLVGMDAEWGLSMRLDSTVKYPWQMTLGAIEDDYLIYEMGKDIGQQLNRIGVHINFAPVVDVNVNPNNPVIKARSFGENRQNVANKGVAYMKGLQFHYVLANAKHFPGHGDTDKDSHKTLPVVNHPKNRLDSVELYPFKQLIDKGVASLMMAHLNVPAYTGNSKKASSLSKSVVSDLLKDTMGFKGLIVTDALNMKGVSAAYEPGKVDLEALLAGNDVLLFAEDVPKAISEIQKAIKKGDISMEEIERRCHKILKAKNWVGLHKWTPISMDNLNTDLTHPKYHNLNDKLYENAITVLENKNDVLPISKLGKEKTIAISFGKSTSTAFHEHLRLYDKVDTLQFSKIPDALGQKKLFDKIADYSTVILSVHQQSANPYRKFKVDPEIMQFAQVLKPDKKVILSVFANPYALHNTVIPGQLDALIMAYQNDEGMQKAAAKVIFGGIGSNGKLPVSISNRYPEGSGIKTQVSGLFNYVYPESLELNRDILNLIDTIVVKGLQENAYPGCQVLVAKDGKVFYHKAFGYHTYDSLKKVTTSDIYDLASITKIAATLPSVMKLTLDGRINLDLSLCDYLPELVDTTVYSNLVLREILAHQAGLKAWIPFYQKTLHKGQPKYQVYSLEQSELYAYRVAENLYINKFYRDSIMHTILKTPLKKEHEYLYSDLGYFFLKQIVENMVDTSLDVFVEENLYKPLGMYRTAYHPRNKFAMEEIVPTEKDKLFRKQLVHGDVHDPAAAMLGGVGGHAGLFGNANDLAKLMQFYLNGGEYAGHAFLSDSIVSEFTRCQFCDNDNRRGAGFDKPQIDDEGGPACTCVSPLSFGHSGFTGTYAWADPEHELIYVFLSNRIHPTAANKKLIKMNIRTDIQEIIYQAIEENHMDTTAQNQTDK